MLINAGGDLFVRFQVQRNAAAVSAAVAEPAPDMPELKTPGGQAAYHIGQQYEEYCEHCQRDQRHRAQAALRFRLKLRRERALRILQLRFCRYNVIIFKTIMRHARRLLYKK